MFLTSHSLFEFADQPQPIDSGLDGVEPSKPCGKNSLLLARFCGHDCYHEVPPTEEDLHMLDFSVSLRHDYADVLALCPCRPMPEAATSNWFIHQPLRQQGPKSTGEEDRGVQAPSGLAESAASTGSGQEDKIYALLSELPHAGRRRKYALGTLAAASRAVVANGTESNGPDLTGWGPTASSKEALVFMIDTVVQCWRVPGAEATT